MITASTLLAACSGSGSGANGPTLKFVAYGGSVAFGIFKPGIGTQPLQPLCVQGGGKVLITKVTPRVTSGKITLVDWGVRARSPQDRYHNSPIGAPSSVAALHEGFTHQALSSPCSALPNRSDELLVAVKSDTVRAYTDGFWIDYRSDGHSRRMLNPTMVRFKP